MRTRLPVILLLVLAGCATPDQVANKQLAYYGPACKKLGYTTQADVAKCVDHKIGENNYFWATQPTAPESGAIRPSTPIPPEPPPRSN
jgi:hypothetical protein